MRARLATMVLAAALLGAAVGAAPASAFGLKDLDLTFTDQNGAPSTQAGSHAFAWTTDVAVETEERDGKEFPIGAARDIVVDFPPGLIGDPFAVPRCSAADFVDFPEGFGENKCSDATALGVIKAKISFLGVDVGSEQKSAAPLYNLEPAPGKAVRLGFVILGIPVVIDAGIRPTPPYNAYAGSFGIPQGALFYASDVTVWGNPASAAHDDERGRCAGNQVGCSLTHRSERPFFTLPRACTGTLGTSFRARSWQDPHTWLSGDATTAGMSGCAKLLGGFSPELDAQPTAANAEAPSGAVVELKVPNPGLANPEGISSSDIKKTVVALPAGITINPSQAEGLQTCTPAQFKAEKADSAPGAGCPEASKIGSLEVESPLLEGEILRGSAYVAQQDDPATATPGAENPFDTLIALYFTIKSPRYGINVGLAGKVEPDPRTGQIVTTFDDLPQLPFSDFRLKLREGARSPLITPALCGSYETVASFTPWADPASTATSRSSFKINRGVGGGPCPPGGTPPFEPGFAAGTQSNSAATYSPFNMRLTRRDGDQDLTRFDATLPAGMLAKLAGVAKCPDAAIAQIKAKTGRQELASPSCPASSQIGNVRGGAGVGSVLTYVSGKVYLAGPFAGAPLSVVGVVPAVAGPFDVGVVATRQALIVDRVTGVASVDGALSEPIPHMLAGIPLKVRDIQVAIDRPEFTLNPTSCDPMATTSAIWGGGLDVFSTHDDAPVGRSARFQVANCSRLGFKPHLRIDLRGGTRRGANPALRAILRPKPGNANIEKTIVRLPRSAFLDQAHIKTICTRVQWAQDNCPPNSRYGRVVAHSPLLDEPLRGPAYLRSSNNLLPDLVFDLRGEVNIESGARIDSIRGGIRAIFAGIPDAPLSRVVVNMAGGKRSLIVNSRNLCDRPNRNRANVRMDGHNGAIHKFNPLVRNANCKRRKAAKGSAQERVQRANLGSAKGAS